MFRHVNVEVGARFELVAALKAAKRIRTFVARQMFAKRIACGKVLVAVEAHFLLGFVRL